jgi:tyrosyl-tRNA synthetase
VDAGLCKSKSDVRRLIKQGGAYINGNKITGFDQKIIDDDLHDCEVLLRAGKKKYHKIIFN